MLKTALQFLIETCLASHGLAQIGISVLEKVDSANLEKRWKGFTKILALVEDALQSSLQPQ